MSKKGLGRGFESLIPTDLTDDEEDSEVLSPSSFGGQHAGRVAELPINFITPDENQPRHKFDEQSLNELAESIREHGVLQPIVVSKIGNNLYQIVAGERRWRASKIAGLKTMPTLIRSMDDQKRLEVSLIENLQREDLNIIETAMAYARLKEQFNLTNGEIAARVGKAQPTIGNTMRLLTLPAIARKALADGDMTEGQARPLISAPEEVIAEIVPRIISENWSSRRVEQFMVQWREKQKKDASDLTVGTAALLPYENETAKLSKRFGSKIAIQTSSRGNGKIVIRFKDAKDFKRQYKLLAGE